MAQSTRHRVAGARRRVLGAEVRPGAEAGHCDWHRPGLHPHDQVEVVAALGHQHGGAGVGPAPLAPDEPDRHVVVADVLDGLDADDVADYAGGHSLLDRAVEGCVPQDVADHDVAAAASRRFDQRAHLVFAGCERLLQQQVVARVQQRDGGRDVEAVHRAVDRRVSELGPRRQLLRGREAARLRDAEALRRHAPAQLGGIGDADDPKAVGALLGIRGVADAAMARADDHGGDGACGGIWLSHRVYRPNSKARPMRNMVTRNSLADRNAACTPPVPVQSFSENNPWPTWRSGGFATRLPVPRSPTQMAVALQGKGRAGLKPAPTG